VSEGIDPMDPGQVKSGARMNTLSVAMGDYKALWSRCQKAEAERDARAEVGYAVEARALREQLATQRKDFEARLKAAEELAEILGFLFDGPDDPRSFSTRLAFSDHDDDTIRAALAQFRKDQEETK